MKFNDELRHELLFQQVKDIYEYFEDWAGYTPTVGDPEYKERVKKLSDRLGHKFQSIIQDLEELHIINIDSHVC